MIIEGLHFSYKHFRIFLDFNLTSRSRVIILKGPSGCGKTTLLKLISRILKPDEIREFDVREGASLILQEDSLFPWLTGIDNIQKVLRLSRKQILDHPMYTLVASHSMQKAFTMSYGQRRMLELFRAILHKPPLLCLDEPFNFLDPESRRSIIKYLNTDELPNTRIVLSTHYNDDLDEFEAETFLFEGSFPIQRLKKV